jgi:hypothetical protein
MSDRKPNESLSHWLRLSKLPRRQDPVADQMKDLIDVAIHLGLHDAADWIKEHFVQILP